MGLKEQRDARREELFSEFVSVKDLIQWLSDREGLDISEVAAELEERFRDSGSSAFPEYGFVDEATIKFVPYSPDLARGHLMGMLSDTIMGCGHGDASDHHGWLRKSLFPFLLKNGMEDVSALMPAWQPQDIDENDVSAIVLKSFADSPYSTPLFDLQRAAIDQFYLHRGNVDPRKEEVTEWLEQAAIERGVPLSANVAEAMFTIIKPIDHNPKKRRR